MRITGLLFLAILFSRLLMASEVDTTRVSRGDLTALNAAFQALVRSDGHVAEELSVVIGKSIARNPENFLKAYKKHAASVTRLDALVGNLGPAFVDDFQGQAAEIRKRIKALQGVNTKELKSLAAKCIEALKEKHAVVDR